MPWTPPDRGRAKKPAPTVRSPPPPRAATSRAKRAPVWMSQYVGETDQMTSLGCISSARTIPPTGGRGGGSGGNGSAVQDGGEVQGQGQGGEAEAGGAEGGGTEPPDPTGQGGGVLGGGETRGQVGGGAPAIDILNQQTGGREGTEGEEGLVRDGDSHGGGEDTAEEQHGR